MASYKIPRSVLVVIYTTQRQVLLLERAPEQGQARGFWQSVTGSLDFSSESFADCAVREVREETGLDALAPQNALRDWLVENTYDIYPSYLSRYAPGVTRNTERVFGLRIPAPISVRLAPKEHVAQQWLDWQDAAQAVRSASNEAAIRRLGAMHM